ncbi:MAG: DEAD/DEAH box helicase [Planctomycetota bacterium]
MTELFATDQTFKDLGLSEPLLRGIESLGYEHPTIIQSKLIPVVIEGRDVMGQSKTGTGKTAAFSLPILERLLQDPRPFASLILVPTRELAIQVAREMRTLSRFTDLHEVAIYGGQPMKIQGPKLKKGPHIIVGTPGRIMDFHRRGQLPYDQVQIAVLDEVDRMLDIGFRDDIRKILGTMRQKHQTIFVSATISREIQQLGERYMHDPVRLDITSSRSLTVEQVNQRHIVVKPWDKRRMLLHLLRHEDPALTLIFCRTKQTVDALSEYLKRKGIDSHAIHGDMYQNKRNRVMRKLRAGELSVLVASDLAARGLDVDDITHVINYDVPEDPEIYVHRIGRTARAGRDGVAWSFVTPDQGGLLSDIERLTNVEIPEQKYPDFQPGPEPPDVIARRESDEKREEAKREEFSRVPVAPPVEAEVDESKFPGGAVPVAMPGKRMGGRLRIKRR